MTTALRPEQLRNCADPERLGFTTTTELADLPGGLGQTRAEEALRFALNMAHPGYHVFVMGEPGTGRHATIFRLLEELAAHGQTPPDLCYIHNFTDPRTPLLLRLPAGRGNLLRAALQKLSRELTPAINGALNAAPHTDRVEALTPVLAHLTRNLRQAHADLPEVLTFIEAISEDIIANIAQGGSLEEEGCGEDEGDPGKLNFQRYQVNLLVDHGQTRGAPVVCEDNPGFGKLLGSIEYLAVSGGQSTHFKLIRAGALHQANGGYLVMDAARLLNQPLAWDGLKRTLRSGRIAIEPPADAQAWSSQATLRPQPAPCQLKLILTGERELFYLLTENDPDFVELFKVAADFNDELLRSPENEIHFARLLATLGRQSNLLPFSAPAVARLIDEAARQADHAQRLSLHTRKLADLMREADYHARQTDGNAALVHPAAIEAALEARRRRADRYPSHVLDAILEGSTLISTSGERAGQTNALVVLELAGERFGHPVRVTATARVGDGDVVDIERETELGGAIHSKGVLILTAFLAARYARHQPLSLAASLVFEQSYGEVEGDSASLAELCALLSALAQAPIRQSLALTGSVNQFGEVQVIGGVNEKIEGFFDLCQARGLNGEQGVLIPAASVPHLMLQTDLVAATQAGRFHIWPVHTVDEAMELLTGLPAGCPQTKGSLNERVALALAEMAAVQHPGGHQEGPSNHSRPLRPRRQGLH